MYVDILNFRICKLGASVQAKRSLCEESLVRVHEKHRFKVFAYLLC